MIPFRIVGIAAVILGIVLLIMGFSASDSLADRVSNFWTGRYTEKTMWYLIIGAVCVIGGGLLAMFGGRRVSR